MSHSPLAPTLLPPMRSVGMGISGSPPPQNLGGQQWGWGLINDGGAVNYRGFFYRGRELLVGCSDGGGRRAEGR